MTKTIDELVASYNEVMEAAQKQILDSVKELFNDLFEKFPFVESVQWMQYTPIYHDGDGANFGVSEFVVFGSSSADEEISEEDDDYDEDYGDVDDYYGYVDSDHPKALRTAIPDYYFKDDGEPESWAVRKVEQYKELISTHGEESLKELASMLASLGSVPDEILEELGEGRVVVTRDGIEVYEYDQ